MESLEIKKIINLIMEGKIEIPDLFFFVDAVGYVQIDDISFFNNEILVSNCQVDIKEHFYFDDKLFIENCKKILTNP